MERRFVIWGAGERGKRLFPHIKEYVDAFIDISPEKQGMSYCGKPVISFETFKQEYPGTYIIISYSHEDEVIRILKENHIDRYFRMTECPGEFQEAFPRNNLKYYINKILESGISYAIYGLNLYAYILNEWIKEFTGSHIPMIPQKLIEENRKRLLCDDLDEYTYFDADESDNFTKIFVTTEAELALLEKDINLADKILNVYDCSDQIEEYHNVMIEKYYNIHHNQRCFIVATGPSLRMEDLDTLYDNDEISFSMNRIWYAFEKTRWRPTFYVAGDYRFFLEDKERLNSLPVKTKFLADTYPPFWEEYHDLSYLKFHYQYEYHADSMPKFSTDFSRKAYHGCSITYNCIELAVYMGFREIFLLGVDATVPGQYHNEHSHFTKKYFSNCANKVMAFYKEPRLAYQAAKIYAEKHGIHIYNATRGGELEIFDRVNFDSLF